MRKVIIFIHLFLFANNIHLFSQNSKTSGLSDALELHPRSRKWAYPNNGTVTDGHPALLWPGIEGKKENKKVFYKVEIATDSLFHQIIVRTENQPWALYYTDSLLKDGHYYWRVAHKMKTDSGWLWSAKYDFNVHKENIQYPVSQKIFLERTSQAHPRLWQMNDRLENFKRSNSSNPEAKALLERSKKWLKFAGISETPTRPRDSAGLSESQKSSLQEFIYHGFGEKQLTPVKSLCVSYWLTGDIKYLNAAIQRGIALSQLDPNGPATKDDFNNGNVLEALAWVYDAGFDHITTEQKNSLKNAIQNRGAKIYNNMLNRFELQFCDNHIWQHILRNFSITAIAVAHDIPESKNWLSYLYQVWNARFPTLATEDGGAFDGNGYFKVHFETLIYLPYLFGEYMGVDYFKKKWMQELPYYLVYTLPSGEPSTGYGDQHEDLPYPAKIQATFADALSQKVDNSTLQTYVSQLRKDYPAYFSSSDDVFLYFRLFNKSSDGSKLPKDENVSLSQLPKLKVFKDVGLAAYHSNLGSPSKDLSVYFNANPFGASGHGHAAQNAFTINYHGKIISTGTGYYSNFSDKHNLLDYRSSSAYNTILVDSLNQKIGEEGYGWIARSLNGNRIQYVLGDASNAYGNVVSDFWLSHFEKNKVLPDSLNGYGNALLKKFRRHFLILDDNIILIYDELAAGRKNKWTWQFHSENPIATNAAISGKENIFRTSELNGFVFTQNPSSAVSIDTFRSPAVNWKQKINSETGEIDHFDKQYHYGVTTSKDDNARFISLLVFDKKLQPEKITVQNGILYFNIGKWQIQAVIDGKLLPALNVSSNTKDASFDYGDLQRDLSIIHSKSGSSLIREQQSNGKYTIIEAVDELPSVTEKDRP